MLENGKKSVDEESTTEYPSFYQLDWPPERVPPLIELVYFFCGPMGESGVLRFEFWVAHGAR